MFLFCDCRELWQEAGPELRLPAPQVHVYPEPQCACSDGFPVLNTTGEERETQFCYAIGRARRVARLQAGLDENTRFFSPQQVNDGEVVSRFTLQEAGGWDLGFVLDTAK